MAASKKKLLPPAEQVSLLLEQNQWSYTVLGELIGVSKTAIHHYVTGQRGISSAQVKSMEALTIKALDAKTILKNKAAAATKPDKVELANVKRSLAAKVKSLRAAEEWLARYENYATERKNKETVALTQVAFLQQNKYSNKSLQTLKKSVQIFRRHLGFAGLDKVVKRKAEVAGLKQEIKVLSVFLNKHGIPFSL